MTTVTPSTARRVDGRDRYADVDREDGVARERTGPALAHSRESAAEGSGLVQRHRRTGITTERRTLDAATAVTRPRPRNVAR